VSKEIREIGPGENAGKGENFAGEGREKGRKEGKNENKFRPVGPKRAKISPKYAEFNYLSNGGSRAALRPLVAEEIAKQNYFEINFGQKTCNFFLKI
jgi:hypothetical protein